MAVPSAIAKFSISWPDFVRIGSERGIMSSSLALNHGGLEFQGST